MDAAAYLAEHARLVDAHLEARVPPADEAPAGLHGAMRHLLFPGGKRLRPALAFAGCAAAGGPAERALAAAAAVELLHTYTLVHDDLPCMDDDVTRRGLPTVHVAFGESLAVLAGDALQALAFEVLAAADAEPQRVAAAVAELAAASGSRALCGGQADDLVLPASADALAVESIHRRKSAALIAASVTLGARLGGADEALLGRLRRFGTDLGLAFQITDDVLDEADAEPCSMVRVLGLEGARCRADEKLAAALQSLEGLGEDAAALRELARLAVHRDV